MFSSFQGQDQFVLAVCGEQRGGFFLDSGASDGVWGSNTHMLETEYDWHGICVEPNDALYARLVQNRSCVCLNCCLYDRDGEVPFLEAAEVYGGIVTHYHPGHPEFVLRLPVDKAASPAAPEGVTGVNPARTPRLRPPPPPA